MDAFQKKIAYLQPLVQQGHAYAMREMGKAYASPGPWYTEVYKQCKDQDLAWWYLHEAVRRGDEEAVDLLANMDLLFNPPLPIDGCGLNGCGPVSGYCKYCRGE